MSSINGTCTDCSTDSCLITGFLYKTLWQEVDPTNPSQGTKFNGNVTVTGCLKTDCIEPYSDAENQVEVESNLLITPDKTSGNTENPIRNFELKNRNLAICDANGNGPVGYPAITTDPRWGYSYMLVHGGSDFRDIVRIRKSQNYNSIFNQFGAALQITAPEQAVGEDITIQLGRDFVSQNNAAIMAFKYAGNGSPLNTFRIDTNGNQASVTPSFVITMPPPPQLGKVGIHIAQPQYDFDVQGDTAIRNITTGNIIMYVDAANGDFTLNAADNTRMMYLDGNSTSFNIGKGSGTVQGTNSIAIGINAGQSQSNNSIAIGSYAGQTTQGTSSIAIGIDAGKTTQANSSVAIGSTAGTLNQGLNSTAVGNQAGRDNQGTQSSAFGFYAGRFNQGASATAVGYGAGETSQGSQTVAVGLGAGNSNQSVNSTAVGVYAGQTSQGTTCFAGGLQAGQTSQGDRAIALGSFAGQTSQGSQSVAIGHESGKTTQGVNAVSIGVLSGNSGQAASSVAVGPQAGQTTQGGNSVAIGNLAGTTTQGSSAVAVGVQAGRDNQGQFAVAIGRNAGILNQHANSIVLNATGTDLNTSATNQFLVGNIRTSVTTGGQQLFYDPTTKEIHYNQYRVAKPIMVLERPNQIIPNNTPTRVTFNAILAGDLGTSGTVPGFINSGVPFVQDINGYFTNTSGVTVTITASATVQWDAFATGYRFIYIALYDASNVQITTFGNQLNPAQDGQALNCSQSFAVQNGQKIAVVLTQTQGNNLTAITTKLSILPH